MTVRTFEIPSGSEMLNFVCWLTGHQEDTKKEALQKATVEIERNKDLIEAGLDRFILCDDYCFNRGPFLSRPCLRNLSVIKFAYVEMYIT